MAPLSRVSQARELEVKSLFSIFIASLFNSSVLRCISNAALQKEMLKIKIMNRDPLNFKN